MGASLEFRRWWRSQGKKSIRFRKRLRCLGCSRDRWSQPRES